MMTTLTVSAKGWVVIPSALRKKYGLHPGAQVKIVDYGGTLGLVPLFENPIEQGLGMLADLPSLTEELLKEHAEELERDERKGRS
jgi:AbrB family looped-hinge helix DNA binding protein